MVVEEKRAVDPEALLMKGDYAILDQYALKDELQAKLHKTFLDGVEQLQDAEARRGVEKDGLRNLHLHFPSEKVQLLEQYISETLADDLYYWSYRVGAEQLKLLHPFYIDYLIVIRIHYPYLVAKKAGPTIAPSQAAEKTRQFKAALRNPMLAVNHLAKNIRKRNKIKEHLVAYDAVAYHGDLPTAARSHGPHIDTWYGHSYDGLNLWLSIDGVNEDNTVILYPELFGARVPYDPKSMYLAAGVPLPEPRKIKLAPGELLVFNPEMLHGTQVNISDETRVALTTRLNPHEPRFNDDAPFNCEHWFSSVDMEKRRFGVVKMFPANKYQGEPSVVERPNPVDPRSRFVTLDQPVAREGSTPLCPADQLREGEKLAIDAPNLKLLVVRTADGIKAYDRRCPHLSVDLVDGHHDAEKIFCPGHGIAFSLKDGASKCSSFKLRAAKVVEEGGMLVLVRGPAAKAGQAAAETEPAL